MSCFLNFTKNCSQQIQNCCSPKDKEYNIDSEDEKDIITRPRRVSFGKVKVVQVESYKSYNSDEIIIEMEEDGYLKKCGPYFKCSIF